MTGILLAGMRWQDQSAQAVVFRMSSAHRCGNAERGHVGSSHIDRWRLQADLNANPRERTSASPTSRGIPQASQWLAKMSKASQPELKKVRDWPCRKASGADSLHVG